MSWPHDREVNLAIFAVLWCALVAWQVTTIRRPGLPSFGAVLDLAKRWWPTRWALLLGWAWLGWHLFVRTTP